MIIKKIFEGYPYLRYITLVKDVCIEKKLIKYMGEGYETYIFSK